MGTTVTWPLGTTGATATSYTIPAAEELNWAALSSFLIALAQGAQATTFQKFAIRKATTTPVTVAVTDCAVGSNLASPGAVGFALPPGVNKQVFFIFDDKGDAGTNNITITPDGAETIGGAGTLVLNHNREGAMLVYLAADTDWKIVYRGAPLSSIVIGDLPTITIAKGGTNSTASLNNNRFMVSSGGAIVEASAITASRAVVSDSNGLPTAASTTTTQINYFSAATGTTGTTSTNVVFSTSPTLITPALGNANATSIINDQGAEGTPSYTFSLDPDTGMYSPGANQVSLVTGGTTRLAITNTAASFAVPIGTTAVTNTAGVDIQGTNTNDNAASGYVGEYIESKVSSETNYSKTTGNYMALTSISLTAGDWDVTGVAMLYRNGATFTVGGSEFIAIIGGTTESSSGSLQGYDRVSANATALTTNNHLTLTIPRKRISIASTTTFYLNVSVDFSAGTPQFTGSLTARRVR